ncbi:undecaprenyl/decaprenyl-phosphate alpha-N-acetylglucosaminyl 1-phosphate transferase [Gulosibacter macacae]|uniref:Undecaprenyl/decaprenyl-phosphate alpha-N-acetylglucosaminyl 1-phosphate transferase n=1 Tax=Gulosibacter macacae TaxID=2488791 RepID=A0A3P3W0Z7_9MICO|nr:MraY family glycosyltransferase [Gulosibacter macacae]RRJ88705.1 undecaprenyl/decaprenyl-phosphate alpha-N-acetylglucosaminyl 1-phosphate transferase [Gulosibacter macacae]
MRFYALIIFFAAVVSALACWGVYRMAMRHRWYPAVRERDVHRTPKPRLGGIAMYFAVLVALAIASQIGWFSIVFVSPTRIWGIIIAATIVVLVGVIDDFVDLDWMVKLAAQIAAGTVLAMNGVAITSLPVGGITVPSQWLSVFITVLAVVLVMNAVNFIDGLDGLVAGIAIIANSVFLVYAYLLTDQLQTSRFGLGALLSAIVVGVCFGFLPWNWNPSRMFMGDGGALLVGLLMASSTIAVTGEVDPAFVSRDELFPAFLPLLFPFAVMIVPIADFSMAVIRRLSAGKSPFSADKKHLHHRLLDMGHTQRRAVLIFYSWASVIGVSALLAFVVRDGVTWWVFLLIGMVVCTALTVAPLTSHRKRMEKLAQRSSYGDDDDEYDPLDALGVDEADRVRRAPAAPLALGRRMRTVLARDTDATADSPSPTATQEQK